MNKYMRVYGIYPICKLRLLRDFCMMLKAV